MILQGKLYAESPIYRGNARKTLFTRDGDGTQRLVSLAGEVAGTAQSLMDAFIGKSKDGRNTGLLPQLWRRLFGTPMPEKLIARVDCHLSKDSYPRDHFFDMRMGIKLDEDRWAAEANANYKMETLFRNSVFDISLVVNDTVLKSDRNEEYLFYTLQELKEGRFWFGAGKSKGLGRCRLDIRLPFSPPKDPPAISETANHLTISLSFDSTNPVLVGWNWGKIDPDIPSFAAIEGRLLLDAIRDLPTAIHQRLEMVIGGPILSPDDWKSKFFEYLPRVIAVWLREQSHKTIEGFVFPSDAIQKLGKGKHPLSQKIIDRLMTIADKPFATREEAHAELLKALGNKANMAKRVMDVLRQEKKLALEFDRDAWKEVADSLGLDHKIEPSLAEHIDDEAALTALLAKECKKIVQPISQLIDHRVRLIQSDSWIDEEIKRRQDHVRIKEMLLRGEITEQQWGDPTQVPEGIKRANWEEFLTAHKRVRFQHMLNRRNLQKSISNDYNTINFLKSYRERTRQELAQPHNMDFRAGGMFNREISRKYGKPYDTIFMRMLTWTPSAKENGEWQVYIPGSTIKGAFRKRASQVLKTLWGETDQTTRLLNRLFGTQGKRGLVFFSDAYLVDPDNPEQIYCSMDGVKMDPRSGKPIEEAKADYLYAYGDKLVFRLRFDLQDVAEYDLEALSILFHLIHDFEKGDIPLGGEKTNGMGWVRARVDSVTWLASSRSSLSKKLFGDKQFVRDGLWEKVVIESEQASAALRADHEISSEEKRDVYEIPKAQSGFVSHRKFGGYCGVLSLQAEVLTPLSIAESGQPSFTTTLEEGPVNGWDFFSMAPPEADRRGDSRVYALPSKSIKGAVRHIYTIASNSLEPSPDISHLNPVDSLFGFVGTGQNQAITGRLSFSFGKFENPELAWFKVPYPYGEWQFIDGEWKKVAEGSVRMEIIEDKWRLFPNVPLAPIVEKSDEFKPDSIQANYFRAILPSGKSRFTVKFWNLEKDELQRLIWSLVLEDDMAHKMGRARYLGFGSLKIKLLDDSYLIDWKKRYTAADEKVWRLPLKAEEWVEPNVIEHYDEIKRVLNVKYL